MKTKKTFYILLIGMLIGILPLSKASAAGVCDAALSEDDHYGFAYSKVLLEETMDVLNEEVLTSFSAEARARMERTFLESHGDATEDDMEAHLKENAFDHSFFEGICLRFYLTQDNYDAFAKNQPESNIPSVGQDALNKNLEVMESFRRSAAVGAGGAVAGANLGVRGLQGWRNEIRRLRSQEINPKETRSVWRRIRDRIPSLRFWYRHPRTWGQALKNIGLKGVGRGFVRNAPKAGMWGLTAAGGAYFAGQYLAPDHYSFLDFWAPPPQDIWTAGTPEVAALTPDSTSVATDTPNDQTGPAETRTAFIRNQFLHWLFNHLKESKDRYADLFRYCYQHPRRSESCTIGLELDEELLEERILRLQDEGLMRLEDVQVAWGGGWAIETENP